MIRGSPCRLRIDPAEIERTEIKRVDKHVNHTNRVVLIDPIIQAFGKQRRLPAIHPLDEALYRDLPPKIASRAYHAGRFHTAWGNSCRSNAAADEERSGSGSTPKFDVIENEKGAFTKRDRHRRDGRRAAPRPRRRLAPESPSETTRY